MTGLEAPGGFGGQSASVSPKPSREKILRDWRGGARDATGSRPQGALQGAGRRMGPCPVSSCLHICNHRRSKRAQGSSRAATAPSQSQFPVHEEGSGTPRERTYHLLVGDTEAPEGQELASSQNQAALPSQRSSPQQAALCQ